MPLSKMGYRLAFGIIIIDPSGPGSKPYDPVTALEYLSYRVMGYTPGIIGIMQKMLVFIGGLVDHSQSPQGPQQDMAFLEPEKTFNTVMGKVSILLLKNYLGFVQRIIHDDPHIRIVRTEPNPSRTIKCHAQALQHRIFSKYILNGNPGECSILECQKPVCVTYPDYPVC